MTLIRNAMRFMAFAIILAGTAAPVLCAELAANQILRRGTGAEPATLDPHKAESVPDSNILRDLLEGLVAEGPKGELVPGAAASGDISADGTVYTFHLRPNGKWSSGETVTAADFVYSLRRALD